jgi:hypothetical protein
VWDVAYRRRGLEVGYGVIFRYDEGGAGGVCADGGRARDVRGDPVDELDACVVSGDVEVDHEEDAGAGAAGVGPPYGGGDGWACCGFWG